MAREITPMTIGELQEKLPSSLNEATLYRALQALADAGIVRRIELNHGHAHYELAHGKEHHHHLVCTNCAKLEDFSASACEKVAHDVVRASKGFARISDHSMELFGLCNECAKKTTA